MVLNWNPSSNVIHSFNKHFQNAGYELGTGDPGTGRRKAPRLVPPKSTQLYLNNDVEYDIITAHEGMLSKTRAGNGCPEEVIF